MSRLDERHDRILTTHTGSLPRPDGLTELLFAKISGKPYDAAALARQAGEAVAATAKMQLDLGIGRHDANGSPNWNRPRHGHSSGLPCVT